MCACLLDLTHVLTLAGELLLSIAYPVHPCAHLHQHTCALPAPSPPPHRSTRRASTLTCRVTFRGSTGDVSWRTVTAMPVPPERAAGALDHAPVAKTPSSPLSHQPSPHLPACSGKIYLHQISCDAATGWHPPSLVVASQPAISPLAFLEPTAPLHGGSSGVADGGGHKQGCNCRSRRGGGAATGHPSPVVLLRCAVKSPGSCQFWGCGVCPLESDDDALLHEPWLASECRSGATLWLPTGGLGGLSTAALSAARGPGKAERREGEGWQASTTAPSLPSEGGVGWG